MMRWYICLLVCYTHTLGRGDKTPTESQPTQREQLANCEFLPTFGTERVISVSYNKTNYTCVSCQASDGLVKTLVFLGNTMEKTDSKTYCPPPENACNGLRCSRNGSWSCVPARRLTSINPSCIRSRISEGKPIFTGKKGQRNKWNGADSTIPLFIGFTVGGILLAIVVAGIFLGRNQRTEDNEGSENMTTPMSLSNSEWLSNGNGSGKARQQENLRVEEASREPSREDLSTIPMYDINGPQHKNGYQPYANENGYQLKSTNDDASSMGQSSYYDSDLCVTYYPTDDYSPVRSNRSDDIVMLDDGLLPGGNFVGSVDPQVRDFFDPKTTVNGGNLNSGLHSAQADARGPDDDLFSLQNVWGGQNQTIPGSMTHESITLSLTHAPHYGGMEYVIEDQDLVAFDEPVSYRKQRNAQATSIMKALKEPKEEVMHICVQYRDGDSDFEDTGSVHSHASCATKMNKNEVFDPPKVSPRNDHVQNSNVDNRGGGFHVESPCSESGIEVSCNSKDSCEIRLKTANSSGNMEISCHARSWNENRKGSASGETGNETEMSSKRKPFFGKNENRSRSCAWKSPAAPTHSSSRKYSAPIHCPSSAPVYARTQMTNLTHVFVDVHRNMMSSDEDMLAFNPPDRRRDRNISSVSSSECSSMSDLAPVGRLPTPEPGPFSTSSMPRSYKSPSHQLVNEKRNKSVYLPRNLAMSRTPKPRTVRFSSSGSGEYAIPFGSLVP